MISDHCSFANTMTLPSASPETSGILDSGADNDLNRDQNPKIPQRIGVVAPWN